MQGSESGRRESIQPSPGTTTNVENWRVKRKTRQTFDSVEQSFVNAADCSFH